MMSKGRITQSRPSKKSHFEQEVDMKPMNRGPPSPEPHPYGFMYMDIKLPKAPKSSSSLNNEAMLTPANNVAHFCPFVNPNEENKKPSRSGSPTYLSAETRKLLREVQNISIRNQKLLAEENLKKDVVSEMVSTSRSTSAVRVPSESPMPASTLDDISSDGMTSTTSLQKPNKIVIVPFTGRLSKSLSSSSVPPSSDPLTSSSQPIEKGKQSELHGFSELRSKIAKLEVTVHTEHDHGHKHAKAALKPLVRAKSQGSIARRKKKPANLARSKSAAEIQVKAMRENRQILREKRNEEKPWRTNMRRTTSKVNAAPEELMDKRDKKDVDEPSLKKKPWRHNMKKKSSQGASPDQQPEETARCHRRGTIRKLDSTMVQNYIKQKRQSKRLKDRQRELEGKVRREAVMQRLKRLDVERKKHLESSPGRNERTGTGPTSVKGKRQDGETDDHDAEVQRATEQNDEPSGNNETSMRQKPISSSLTQNSKSILRANLVDTQNQTPANNAPEIMMSPRNVVDRQKSDKEAKASHNESIAQQRLDELPSVERNVHVTAFDLIPERDENVPTGTRDDRSDNEKLRQMVSEIFVRHQKDMEYIRNLNLAGMGKPDEPDAPIPVRGEPESVRKRRMSKPLPMTDEEEAMPPTIQTSDNFASHQRRQQLPDPITFMESVRRKAALIIIPHTNKRDESRVTISEGPLSSSVSSSPVPSLSEKESLNTDGNRGTNVSGKARKETLNDKDMTEGGEKPESTKMTNPEALRLRFMAEMNQLAGIEEAEKQIASLCRLAGDLSRSSVKHDSDPQVSHLKKKASSKNPSLNESRKEFEVRLRRECEQIIAKKLENLLAKQTEATKVTAEAAKQLALLNISSSKDQVKPVNVHHKHTSSQTSSSKQQAKDKEEKEGEEEKSSSKHTESNKSSSSVSTSTTTKNLTNSIKSLITQTESNIPEILSAIDKTERSGENLPRSISEAIEQLTHGSKSEATSKSISEELAAVLSMSESEKTLQSQESNENEESTLKEASLQTEDNLNSSSQRVQSDFSLEISESDAFKDDLSSSGSTHGKLFSRFSMQMFRQHLEEESVRCKHQYQLLKTREKLLDERVKAELEALEMKKKSILENELEKDQQVFLSSLKKKERAILMDFKNKKSEFERLKKTMKVAERERKMILKEQKRLLKEAKAKDSSGKKSSFCTSNVNDANNESKNSDYGVSSKKASQSDILKGMKSMAPSNEEEAAFLEKAKKMLARDYPNDDVSSSSTITNGNDVSSATAFDTRDELDDVDEDHQQDSQHQEPSSRQVPKKMKSLRKSMGAPLKNPLSPVPPSTSSRQGNFVPTMRHHSIESDDSILSLSQTDTASDHSDYDIRINVLQDELKRRIRMAAQLKRQQRQKNKEKFRMQESTLKMQIQKYDKLIEETKNEIEMDIINTPPVVQPLIKTPRQSVSSPTPSSRKLSLEASTETCLVRSLPKEQDETESSLHSMPSLDESSNQSTILASPKLDKLEDPNFADTSTEPSIRDKNETEKPMKRLNETASEDLNYSDDFTSSSTSPSSSKATLAMQDLTHSPAKPVETQAVSSLELEKNEQKDEAQKEALAEQITSLILDDLIKDTCQSCDILQRTEDEATSKEVANDGDDNSCGSETITFAQPVSSFSHDDHDLYQIQLESEAIRQKQLLIEEEIKRIEQEAMCGQRIPNKPPPPYIRPTPPSTSSVPTSTIENQSDQKSTSLVSSPMVMEKSKPIIFPKHVPNSRDEIVRMTRAITSAAYEGRLRGEKSKTRPKLDELESLVPHLSGDERSVKSRRIFIEFITDFVYQIVEDVYSSENTHPDLPPWMNQKQNLPPKKLPSNLDELCKIVEREALVHLGFEKRAQKENLIVRWSQKKRDKVDQILVRELHSEEPGWTDYSADEITVKNKVASDLFDILIADTVLELKSVGSCPL